jgi:glycosyltransferase involved in cell wall biosynthesis
MPLITAIVPIRNRSGIRLENCLHSLRWQEMNGKIIDSNLLSIIVLDYGSQDEHIESIKSLCEQYQARHVRIEAFGVWNRSKALNLGIRHADGDWVFCTDIDMIFSPNFVASIIEKIQNNPNAFIISRCHDLPQKIDLTSWQVSDYQDLYQKSELRNTQGTGACQVARKQFFYDIHGYDEGFEFWGAEDDDLRKRARRYGLKEISISPQASMLHQWHPTTKNDRPWRKRFNAWRYYLTNWKIVKNKKNWGGLPT